LVIRKMPSSGVLPGNGPKSRTVIEQQQGSWRVHDHALLPSLARTNLLFLDGEYVESLPLEKPLVTLIPPTVFGPPEKAWTDKVETEIPGLAAYEVVVLEGP
jgi:hypothetical protein